MKTKGSKILKIFGLSLFVNVNFKEDEEVPLPEKLRLTQRKMNTLPIQFPMLFISEQGKNTTGK